MVGFSGFIIVYKGWDRLSTFVEFRICFDVFQNSLELGVSIFKVFSSLSKYSFLEGLTKLTTVTLFLVALNLTQ